jgi:hypothetical protein
MLRVATILAGLTCLVAAAQEDDLAEDRKVAEANGWIYDDLSQGIDAARQSGKPLLVALRCPP